MEKQNFIIKGLIKNEADEIIGVASTEDRDRDGEIIKQAGWELDEYKKNPVVLAQHNSWKFPIGKTLDIAVEGGKLLFKFVLTSATQEAREAAQLIKEGILNTFSVGFLAKERDEYDRSIITRAELYEISVVSVPANPNAVVLAKGLKDNATAQALVAKWEKDEKLKSVLSDTEMEQYRAGELHTADVLEIFTAKQATAPSREEEYKAEVSKVDKRLLRNAVSSLQELLTEANKKGGVSK